MGKSYDPKTRYRRHLSQKRKTACYKWISSLLSLGLKPEMQIIEVCEDSNWEERERVHISYYRSIGGLLNHTDGGEGGNTMGGRKMTPEQCRKITESKLGKPNKGAALSNIINKGTRVAKYTIAGEFVDSYLSINEAARSINKSGRRIYAMVTSGLMNGRKVKSVGGFVFKKIE